VAIEREKGRFAAGMGRAGVAGGEGRGQGRQGKFSLRCAVHIYIFRYCTNFLTVKGPLQEIFLLKFFVKDLLYIWPRF
jgi:hypothetical protein